MILKIRQEQLDGFLPQTDDERIDFIVAHLRDDVPELLVGLPDDSVRDMVRGGVARARSHKLKRLGDLTSFVAIMFEVAPDFDEHPALRSALDDPHAAPDERLDGLFVPELDEAWEEAARYTSAEQRAAAWFPELKEGQE